MLEQTALHLRPWNSPPFGEPGGSVRAVVDETGKALGSVRQQPTGSPWWRRLKRRVLEVCEAPDGSLVFALRRSWGWPAGWHVVDAEGRLVGTLRGHALLDGFGHFLAAMEPPDERGQGRFVALDGSELCSFAVLQFETRLTFAPITEGNPFAKMMLLGAVLSQDV